MIDDFVRDLDHLQKAESLVGRIWLKFLARQFGIFAIAGLICVFGLGMTNVAGFYALVDSLGPVWAAVVVAAADFVIATITVVVARSSQPGPEIYLASDARKMAVEAVLVDARDLKTMIDGFVQEFIDIKHTIGELVQDPIDVALQNLVIPAATSMIKGLRSKKDEA
jgi:hypothetical protein